MAVATPPALEREINELGDYIVELANAQYETPEFKKLLSVPLSKERAAWQAVQSTLFTINRRDCWPFVMGKAPLDVKRLIWEHEEDELIGHPSKGKADHTTLAIKQGALWGLTAEDFAVEPVDSMKTCFWAWRHLAETRPFLQALAASSILEVVNSNAIIRGGALSARRGKLYEEQLGVPMSRQVNTAEHIEADVTHSLMLMKVAKAHCTSSHDIESIKTTANESLAIFRTYHDAIAEGMLAQPGPSR